MRSLLILTDFSEPSFRAAEYGCALSDTLQAGRIVLYHAYQTAAATTDLPVSAVRTNSKVHVQAVQALGALRDRLESIPKHPLTIDLLAEDTFLPDRINECCREQAIDLIVMGVSGKSGAHLLGGTAARMLTTSRWPVIVVPAQTPPGSPVTKIVLASDLHNMPGRSGERLSALLDSFHAPVEVIHVGGDNIVQGILDSAGRLGASLVVAVPRRHGLLASMFHRGVTEKLAYNSPTPLLFFPEE
ncbi:MAG TPA: universal stress protein [Puia sp.]|nr:universal stress protein [Puia sp.]